MKRGVLLMAGLALLLVLGYVVVALINRSPEQTAANTLTVYLPFDEEKIYEELSAGFLSTHSSVELTFKYIEATDAKDYEAKVVNEIANGAGPDIWIVRSDWIPKHAAKSLAFEPSAGEPDPIASAKTVIEPAVVDLSVYGGKLYGVPLFADSLALIYNYTLLDSITDSVGESQFSLLKDAPATWDILKQQAAVLTQKSGRVISRSGLAIGTAETTYAPVDILSAMLAQNEVSILTEDGQSVAFNLAQFKDGQSTFPATNALNLYTSFARSGEANYSWNNDLGGAVDAFKNQKAVAFVGYHSQYKTLSESNLGFELGLAPLPQLAEKTDRIDFGVSWSHIINSQAANPALAKQYLSYLGGSEASALYAEKTGKISVAPDTSTKVGDSISRGESATRNYRAQLKTVRQLTKLEWQKVDEILQDTIKLVTNSGQSVQASVDSAATRFKELL